MKKILGLDLGTNSIGAALINLPETLEDFGKEGNIEWLGTRILPIDSEYLQNYEIGKKADTKAAARRKKRSVRRLKHRYKLRRTRLIKVFKILGWIDNSYPEDFKKTLRENPDFKFDINSYLPFSDETLKNASKELGFSISDDKKIKFPQDWIVYYLRKKALSEKITIQELARIIYMFNQRRGFKSSRKDLKDSKILNYDDFKKIKDEILSTNEKKNKNVIDEKIETKFVSITKVKLVEKINDEKDKNEKLSYKIEVEDTRIEPWEEKFKKAPDWLGKEKTFLICQKIDKNGKFTQNKPQAPTDDDWTLNMVALDEEIYSANKHPGEFFFDKICKDKNYKIRHQVIYREKYINEFIKIFEKQIEYHSELLNRDKLEEIAKTLYKNNKEKQEKIKNNDLLHLFINDIIYYQRDLKSQKHLISGCQYEKLRYRKNGVEYVRGVKVIPASSPLFQEFRIWQDIHNIRIYQKEGIIDDKQQINIDVTSRYMTDDLKAILFEKLNYMKEINEEGIFSIINEYYAERPSNDMLSKDSYFINLFKNRDYIHGNTTIYKFKKIFNEKDYKEKGNLILTNEKKLYKLWHIIYSINSTDKVKSDKGIETALKNNDFCLPDEIINEFKKLPEFEKKYGSFSYKALKKLLPVIRCGKYWDENEINNEVKLRIQKIINGEFDENIDNYTRDNIKKYFLNIRSKKLTKLNNSDFQGLPVWLAGYVVYGRHSELTNNNKYTNYNDINAIQLIPNNSLRNPIVEQVLRETLNLIKDIWKNYGQPDEIHIELGRELKNNQQEREKYSNIAYNNNLEKERIKKILYELYNNSFDEYIDDSTINENVEFEVKPNPESHIDIEKFRIWKNCSGTNNQELEKLFKNGNKEKYPTYDEIKRYILWLTQKCISPYTGKIIRLSKLFTNDYEIEHIIPKSLLKYDSFENLVICESVINKQKGNLLARQFIRKYSGQTISLNDKDFNIFDEQSYIQHCKNIFKGSKLKNLLAEEVPEGFISRQLNDSRYISKKLIELLKPIVKNDNNLIFTIGSITHELKINWNLNNLWKEILKPRFERLEKENNQKYIEYDTENNTIHYVLKDNTFKDIKRIDHRNHALDALIIACTTREHIRYLNSLNSADNNEELKNIKLKLVKGKIRDFKTPWENFEKDIKDKLEQLVVTFKPAVKPFTKPQNKYIKWVFENGQWFKKFVEQENKPKWLAIRRSLYKENPYGIIYIKEKINVNVIKAVEIELKRRELQNTRYQKVAGYIYNKENRELIKLLIDEFNSNITKIKMHLKKEGLIDSSGNKIESVKVAVFKQYAAKRVKIDESFNLDKINKIPYSLNLNNPLPKILKEHLIEFDNKPNEAFKGEGLELLYKKIGKPISKVTIYERKSDPIIINKNIYEPDAGSIVYFVIYENIKTKERPEMCSISVHQLIEKKLNNQPIAEIKNGFKTIIISPNDLVYVPTNEEWEEYKNGNLNFVDWNDKKHICERTYKMVKSTGKTCYFLHFYISKLILSYDNKLKVGEFGSQNCSEKSIDNIIIKNQFIKLKVDRLGNFKPDI